MKFDHWVMLLWCALVASPLFSADSFSCLNLSEFAAELLKTRPEEIEDKLENLFKENADQYADKVFDLQIELDKMDKFLTNAERVNQEILRLSANLTQAEEEKNQRDVSLVNSRESVLDQTVKKIAPLLKDLKTENEIKQILLSNLEAYLKQDNTPCLKALNVSVGNNDWQKINQILDHDRSTINFATYAVSMRSTCVGITPLVQGLLKPETKMAFQTKQKLLSSQRQDYNQLVQICQKASKYLQ